MRIPINKFNVDKSEKGRKFAGAFGLILQDISAVRKIFWILVPALALLSFQNGNEKPPFLKADHTSWADSVFKMLTPDERIAQLFMVAAYSDEKKQNPDTIRRLIRDYKIGGLIFFQGGPVRQANLTNKFQKLSKVPLLISIDGEWGLAMRLDSTVQFPRQMTLGAIQDDSLIYKMGKEIARECRRMGIHVDLAPVADVNNNPLNPVISNRSFGEDKLNVARKALMYMKGLQDGGVLACAKHFPGHGDTEFDSHKTLPTIPHSKERMDTLELYPFRQLMREGLGSVMVAHLHIPAYDTAAHTASTLSKAVVTDLLKNQLGFGGLVFTDALNMKGVSKFFKPGEVDVKALLAGNDVLLFSEDVGLAIEEIKKAIEKGDITQEEIDARCKKILLAKQWAGLDNFKPIATKDLIPDLNTSQARWINRQLAEASATVLINKKGILPLTRLDTLNIATLSIGYKEVNGFQKMLGNYARVQHFGIDKNAKQKDIDTLISRLGKFNLVVACINNTNNLPKFDFGVTGQMKEVVSRVAQRSKLILDVFANPYALSKFDSLEQNADALVMSYEDLDETEELSAQLIFGGISAKGRLPVTASGDFKLNSGINTSLPIRMKYTVPEELVIDPKKLERIDSIANYGIAEKAYPGCVVLIAKNGKVLFNKAYGYHTYENKVPVQTDDIYDLASITKIAASGPAIMKMVEEKKIGLDDYLCYDLPELSGTSKANIIIREMLTHQSGLKDWIPFWMKTMKKGEYLPGIYSDKRSKEFPLRVADNLYISRAYTDTMFQRIIESPVSDKHEYRYSDLGYYFIYRIVERKTGVPFDKYADSVFYRPMGLPTMTYKPIEKFPLSRIPPTEYDVKFRKQLVHGDVHDPGAAMLGGVGGHAGLFSSASDLAVLMQMYLNKGEYGGRRYLDTATVGEFTRCQYCLSNRRALVFDKPETDPKKESPVCDCVSLMSYGHSGFTGTLTWADPANGLIYVFLSNRVYPDAEKNKLIKLGIRSSIQEVIYEVVR